MFIGFFAGAMASQAQNATPKAGTKSATKKAAPAAKRPPLTRADVQKLWTQGDEQLLLNELRLRGLAFEPEEDWVAQLPRPADMPLAAAEIRKRIPPAPDLDAVASQAPDLLSKLKDAAQKRSEADMTPLVHPDLLANKARVYDLFDTTNYRSHTLGRFAPMDNRRVGVQFFQLTTSQVERLHYLVFSTYGGKIVVRDIVTGPSVAALFLHDEEQLALSKLNLVFRALNDGDDSGLKNLCTPGLYESLKSMGGGLVRGKYVSLDRISTKASVSLDQKSIRVVVRVGYPTPSGRQIQYDVDFERVDKDLKVVRVRDLQGGVIAYDPNIDNYLNRRFGLPDGPTVDNAPQSDSPDFYPLSTVRTMATRAIESGDAKKLKECADQFIEREPTSGEGYGIRAALQQVQGNYDEAGRDAASALDRNATAYFLVQRYVPFAGTPFSTVVLGVSRDKIEYLPVAGGNHEEIPMAAVVQAFFDKPKGVLMGVLAQQGPFLKLDFTQPGNKGKKDKKEYTFAAVGTTCPGSVRPNAKNDLESYPNGSVCASEAANATVAGKIPVLVPHGWQQNLAVVESTIEHARNASATPAKR